MIRSLPAKTPQKELFCHKYWQRMKKQAMTKNDYNQPGLFDYSDYNLVALSINAEKPSKPLRDLDLSFRTFEPSRKKYVTWRGVTNPSYLYPENQELLDYFNRCKNIQPGETLCMKEFPYVSSNQSYAKSYISNFAKDFVNILFEIEIPKGTRFLNNCDRNVLQRCSRFLCTDSKRVQDEKNTYQHIKLTLLPRATHQEIGKPSFIQRILDRIGFHRNR